MPHTVQFHRVLRAIPDMESLSLLALLIEAEIPR
jgi:hypothetical protein